MNHHSLSIDATVENYTQTLHCTDIWHIKSVFWIRCQLFLPLKEMEESEFERQKQGLASILAEARKRRKALWKKSIYCFFVWSRHLFWGRCVLYIEVIFGSEKCSLKDVTIPNPARHPRTSTRNFPATWLQGLCKFRHCQIIRKNLWEV